MVVWLQHQTLPSLRKYILVSTIKASWFLQGINFLLPCDEFTANQHNVTRNNCQKGKLIFSSFDDLGVFLLAQTASSFFFFSPQIYWTWIQSKMLTVKYPLPIFYNGENCGEMQDRILEQSLLDALTLFLATRHSLKIFGFQRVYRSSLLEKDRPS